jgi:hypothetical protein
LSARCDNWKGWPTWQPLSQTLREYFIVRVSPSLGLESERRYFANTINLFAEFLRRQPTIDDLRQEQLSAFGEWLRDSVSSRVSRQRLFGTLHVLRRHCADNGRAGEPGSAENGSPALSAVLKAYIAERSISFTCTREMVSNLKHVDDWRGSILRVDDLSDALLNDWLLHLERRGLSRETVRNKRRMMRGPLRVSSTSGASRGQPAPSASRTSGASSIAIAGVGYQTTQRYINMARQLNPAVPLLDLH